MNVAPTRRMMIALDTETGGLDPKRNPILEVALRIIGPDRTILDTYTSFVRVTDKRWSRCDQAALNVNGITREMVDGGKKRRQVAREVTELFKRHGIDSRNAFYFCQNPTFDRGFWEQIFPQKVQTENRWPYHWFDLASMHFFRTLKAGEDPKSFSKDGIAEHYKLPPEEKPHRALNGVDHLLLIFNHMVG
ncbi:MAG: 3'-5' exonuclease [Chlamydiia bacterium]|nr:3'-5' exonuclease [Chlamydiia bacterium]